MDAMALAGHGAVSAKTDSVPVHKNGVTAKGSVARRVQLSTIASTFMTGAKECIPVTNSSPSC